MSVLDQIEAFYAQLKEEKLVLGFSHRDIIPQEGQRVFDFYFNSGDFLTNDNLQNLSKIVRLERQYFNGNSKLLYRRAFRDILESDSNFVHWDNYGDISIKELFDEKGISY